MAKGYGDIFRGGLNCLPNRSCLHSRQAETSLYICNFADSSAPRSGVCSSGMVRHADIGSPPSLTVPSAWRAARDGMHLAQMPGRWPYNLRILRGGTVHVSTTVCCTRASSNPSSPPQHCLFGKRRPGLTCNVRGPGVYPRPYAMSLRSLSF